MCCLVNSLGFDGGALTLKRKVIDLELTKISMKKLQAVITFDKEVKWRHVKMKVA